MDKLLHNCPNCGGPLTSDGFCEYCKTKIRYANEIEIHSMYGFYKPVEILIKIENHDKNETLLFPFKGYLGNMSINKFSCEVTPDVELTFNGTFIRHKGEQ